MPTRALGWILLTAFAVCLPTRAAAQCYPDVAPGLRQYIENVATALAGPNPPAASAGAPALVTLTVLDRLAGLGDIRPAPAIVDTALNDKQIGAPARSAGTTTLVEKPNFAKVLALAVEHGAVQEARSGTRVTLSTSPYALVVALEGDSDATYRRARLLRHVGLSAGFDLDPATGEGDNAGVENLRRDQLRDATLRIRLTPDRGSRSQAFVDFWRANVEDKIQASLVSLSAPMAHFLNVEPFATALRNFRTALAQGLPLSDVASIETLVLCSLEQHVLRPLAAAPGAVSQDMLVEARLAVSRYAEAQRAMLDASALVDRYLEEIGDRTQASLSGSYLRPVSGSAVMESKLVVETGALWPFKTTVNAGAAWYRDPDPALNQQRMKDVSVSIAAEYSKRSPFLAGTSDFSRLALSVAARYDRAREREGVLQTDRGAAAFQIKIDMPVATGFNLPLSFSIANTAAGVAGEAKRWDKRLHFGLTFDSDKLLAVAKARAAMPGDKK